LFCSARILRCYGFSVDSTPSPNPPPIPPAGTEAKRLPNPLPVVQILAAKRRRILAFAILIVLLAVAIFYLVFGKSGRA
jgi:hypothetical protein